MAKSSVMTVVDGIRDAAHPLVARSADYDPLFARLGAASVVLLGEATHGTHEFYEARARITRRLVEERGFNAIAVEADWPDAYRVNRFVRGVGSDANAQEALQGFGRFPAWMWRNTEVVRLVTWLRHYNQRQPEGRHVGFYGLDLYSLYSSIEAVIDYLTQIDPEAAARARERYACFDHGAEDASHYGHGVMIGTRPSCEDQAVAQLVELRSRAAEYVRPDGMSSADEQFFAEQNARLITNAEAYYRQLFGWRVNTWNLRDRHMVETLMALADHLRRTTGVAKLVVWEHNSHIGDARATEMSEREELNVGQLVRQRYHDEALLVGFTTHSGTVSAASHWGGPVERKKLRPSLANSFESLFHRTKLGDFLLVMDDPQLVEHLQTPRLERAIGVVYRPETERMSHYFTARIADQFDAIIHFDETRALEPLERRSHWDRGEAPETYPFGV